MISQDLILFCSDSKFEATVLDSDVYRKELAYPDKFVKLDARGNVEFEMLVNERMIDHWVATFQKMKEEGIEVPVPIEHTTDPEARRGTMIDLKKEFNPDRGVNSLFAYIKFRDPKVAANLSKTTQVSLFAPPDFVSGKGTRYIRPIRHVALTDYPLVPGLGPFEKAIAASTTFAASLVMSPLSASIGPKRETVDDYSADEFDTPTEDIGEPTMTLAELADQMGVSYEEGSDDDAIGQAILDAWNSGESDEGVEVDDETVVDEDSMLDPVDDGVGDESLMEDDGEMSFDDMPIEDEESTTMSQPIAASMSTPIVNARKIQLQDLARRRKLTPAARDKLIAKYATPKQVAFAMSHGDGELHDDFDDVIEALELNKAIFSASSKTPPQHARSADKSPVVKDAERRAGAK